MVINIYPYIYNVQTLKRAFEFYINGSIHVALATVALIDVTLMQFNVTDKYIFLFFNFLGAIAAYNFAKYSGVSRLYHKNMASPIKAIQILTWACLFFSFFYAFKLPLEPLLYMIPFFILTVLYTVPVFPNRNNLRTIARVKIFIIAVVWTGITVVVPIVYAKATINLDFVIESVQRFLFIIVMMLPFEIRDLKFDATELETIPQTIGITRTKVFGSILLVVFLLLTSIKKELFVAEILSVILISTTSLFFLWGTEKEQSKYYCSFWVESIPILWWLLINIFQRLFT